MSSILAYLNLVETLNGQYLLFEVLAEKAWE